MLEVRNRTNDFAKTKVKKKQIPSIHLKIANKEPTSY